MLRLAWLELVHGLRISDMRRQRRALIKELDAAMADYMASLPWTSSEASSKETS